MEREKLRKRLSEYLGNTAEIVEQQVHAYEHREEEKQNLIRRGLRNALAEYYLDRRGYPRPPGWHSVFFYPGSNRPRNKFIFWFVVIAGVIWFVAKK